MFYIRPATTTDIPHIQLLTRQIWPVTYGEILTPAQLDYMIDKFYNTAELTQQMETPGYTFLMMLEGEKPVGFAAYSTTEGPGIYKLHKIYLHPDCQGKGAGKQLINTVIDAVKKQQGQVLELNVNRYNKARYFYEKIGFTIYEEKDIDIGNGYWMNDYIMRKVL